jgi:aldehyde dehydrogenase (NAD+)
MKYFMSINDYSALARHRNYFRTGITRGKGWRESQLAALRTMMTERADDFYASLWTDLRRGRVEADVVDVKYLFGEAEHALAHVRQWMEPMRVSSSRMLAPSHTRVRFDPLGVGLIIGTWNYPVMLKLSPLIAAICGGNVAVIKPSEVAAATANVIARLIPEYLDRGAFSVVLGAAPETTALLEQQWDHIIFTGGTTVARIVMTAAAKTLTPVVLGLGGKYPAIVHSSADIHDRGVRCAGRRPEFGRQGTMAERAGPPPLTQCRMDGRGELARAERQSQSDAVPTHGKRQFWFAPRLVSARAAQAREAVHSLFADGPARA